MPRIQQWYEVDCINITFIMKILNGGETRIPPPYVNNLWVLATLIHLATMILTFPDAIDMTQAPLASILTVVA